MLKLLKGTEMLLFTNPLNKFYYVKLPLTYSLFYVIREWLSIVNLLCKLT